VCESYEQDLHEAMLQSKLEFEEVRKLKKTQGVEGNGQDKGGSKKKIKPQKPQTMSLDQFNNMNEESNKIKVFNFFFLKSLLKLTL